MNMYFHAGSSNHGCEAIVRSTAALFPEERFKLITSAPDQDLKYGLNTIADIVSDNYVKYDIIDRIKLKLHQNNELYGYKIRAKEYVKNIEPGTVAFSIGGDNYCYGPEYNAYLANINRYFHSRNVKTVLWGCSINPDEVDDNMETDFRRYDLIVARESMTYSKLKRINKNTILCCDPAFTLETKKTVLPHFRLNEKITGINLSPLVINKLPNKELVMNNIVYLIEDILKNPDSRIWLIPHVVEKGNDDRTILEELLAKFAGNSRIQLIGDCGCQELKYIISKCNYFIGARTHSVIAAYSLGIPTLAIGYSTKSKGIALDLFGNWKNFVIMSEDLENRDLLIAKYQYIQKNAETISDHLKQILPNYTKSLQTAVEKVKEI